MENQNAVVETTTTKKAKKKSIALICCLLGGMVGAHKFYEEKYGMGLLYLFTCGFLMIGVVIDLIRLLKAPSVYYVEPKLTRERLNRMKTSIENFSLDQVKDYVANLPVDVAGRIIAIIGGGIAGLGCTMHFDFRFILAGLLIAVVGMGITWLKTRDIQQTLTFAGIPAGIALVAVCGFLLLMGAVIVWLAVKLLLGIDLLEWIADIFGDDKKSRRDDMDFTNPSLFTFPETIQDKQGNTYRLQHSSGDHADYYCPATGATMQVWESDFTSD